MVIKKKTYKGYRQVGIPKLLRYSIQMIRSGELRDILYYFAMKARNIDLSLVMPDELGLSEQRAHRQTSTGGHYLESVLNSLQITSNDVIIDVGSGKGGAIITLSKYPFAQIAGVEISSDMVRIAQENLAKLRIADIKFYCDDASKFNEFDRFNYIYMANPFPCQIMDEVMINVKESLTENPRKMTIIYYMPLCHDIILNSGLFEQVATVKRGRYPFFIYKHIPRNI